MHRALPLRSSHSTPLLRNGCWMPPLSSLQAEDKVVMAYAPAHEENIVLVTPRGFMADMVVGAAPQVSPYPPKLGPESNVDTGF